MADIRLPRPAEYADDAFMIQKLAEIRDTLRDMRRYCRLDGYRRETLILENITKARNAVDDALWDMGGNNDLTSPFTYAFRAAGIQ